MILILGLAVAEGIGKSLDVDPAAGKRVGFEQVDVVFENVPLFDVEPLGRKSVIEKEISAGVGDVVRDKHEAGVGDGGLACGSMNAQRENGDTQENDARSELRNGNLRFKPRPQFEGFF